MLFLILHLTFSFIQNKLRIKIIGVCIVRVCLLTCIFFITFKFNFNRKNIF